jgi:tight adherence protein C
MEVPAIVWMLFAAGGFALAVFGGRGLLEILAALRAGDLARLADPPRWPATRGFIALLTALPVAVAAAPLGAGRWLAALAAGALGFMACPSFLASARRRAELELYDDLPMHLDLIALTLEGGGSLASALAVCAERSPPGRLRRAWEPVVREVQGGVEPCDALRGLEERLGFRLFGSLLPALRAAERLGLPLAPVLRDKARQAAASRFARAEQLARAAPLKLWATLMLCIAPCTLIVLAYPLARALAILAGG